MREKKKFKIKKTGGGFSIAVPKSVVEALELESIEYIFKVEKNKKLVYKPIK